MFKNHRLFSPGFAHDQLLLNAAAMAALGPRMAELQGRASAPARGAVPGAWRQGSAGARAWGSWRLAVIGGAPLAEGAGSTALAGGALALAAVVLAGLGLGGSLRRRR